MPGYIKVSRKILDWEWWPDINTFRLFMYMLLTAWWKDGNYKGKEIQRGSFPSSISDLAYKTGLTENEIRTAIKHLKNTGEITSKAYSKFTVFTIKNYDFYQLNNEQNYTEITGNITSTSQPVNEQITSKSQADNKQITGTNNTIIYNNCIDKKEKKEIKEGKKVKREEDILTDSKESVCQTDVRRILERWNELKQYGIKPIIRLAPSAKRYGHLKARIREYGLENVITAIDRVKSSDFLQGKNNHGWMITFDWFVLPSNFPKVLEGKYDNSGQSDNEFSSEMEAFINGQD